MRHRLYRRHADKALLGDLPRGRSPLTPENGKGFTLEVKQTLLFPELKEGRSCKTSAEVLDGNSLFSSMA
ncbi:MAG: hypothetical protein ACLRSW_05405 [Christensenellaceae bacterium]